MITKALKENKQDLIQILVKGEKLLKLEQGTEPRKVLQAEINELLVGLFDQCQKGFNLEKKEAKHPVNIAKWWQASNAKKLHAKGSAQWATELEGHVKLCLGLLPDSDLKGFFQRKSVEEVIEIDEQVEEEQEDDEEEEEEEDDEDGEIGEDSEEAASD